MENVGIIAKVPLNEPADWLGSLVCVDKPDGSIGVCIDSNDLNRFFFNARTLSTTISRRYHFQLRRSHTVFNPGCRKGFLPDLAGCGEYC